MSAISRDADDFPSAERCQPLADGPPVYHTKHTHEVRMYHPLLFQSHSANSVRIERERERGAHTHAHAEREREIDTDTGRQGEIEREGVRWTGTRTHRVVSEEDSPHHDSQGPRCGGRKRPGE